MARDLDTRDLSRLADGTLDPGRRAEVQAGISASPELTELYERERRVAELLREARATDRAPERLRARIDAQRPSRATAFRLRAGYGGAVAGALAVLVLALVLILPAGTPGAPTVSQAAALALRGVQAPAPARDPHAPGAKLASDIENVYFPNWAQQFGWKAVGQRTDHINGRLAKTVYYELHGHVVAYTIVGAPALTNPPARVTLFEHGTAYRTLMLNGRQVVTWRRAGHTCVLSAAGLPGTELQRLASADPPGSQHGSR
jgi:anti-sigma factor RsiW